MRMRYSLRGWYANVTQAWGMRYRLAVPKRYRLTNADCPFRVSNSAKRKCVKCGGPWHKELFGEGTELEGWCMRCFDWTWMKNENWRRSYGEPDSWMTDAAKTGCTHRFVPWPVNENPPSLNGLWTVCGYCRAPKITPWPKDHPMAQGTA